MKFGVFEHALIHKLDLKDLLTKRGTSKIWFHIMMRVEIFHHDGLILRTINFSSTPIIKKISEGLWLSKHRNCDCGGKFKISF